MEPSPFGEVSSRLTTGEGRGTPCARQPPRGSSAGKGPGRRPGSGEEEEGGRVGWVWRPPPAIFCRAVRLAAAGAIPARLGTERHTIEMAVCSRRGGGGGGGTGRKKGGRVEPMRAGGHRKGVGEGGGMR